MAVYSEDRVGRLRMVLWIVVAIGALVALLAVLTVAAGEHRAAGVVGVVVSGLLLGSSGTALRQLSVEPGPPAKVAVVVTSALCLVAGVLSGSWVAFLLLLIGLGLLFLALLPDEPEGAAR